MAFSTQTSIHATTKVRYLTAEEKSQPKTFPSAYWAIFKGLHNYEF